MSAEENKATIRRWVEEAWNNGNFASAEEIYAANYIMQDPSGPIPGKEGLTQFIGVYRVGFPDLHMTIEDMVAEQDKIAWRFTTHGTHQGQLMGIAPTGKQVTGTGIVISRFEHGKWAQDWTSYDVLGLLQQLGVIPPMG